MATTDTTWYELVNSDAAFSPNQKVQCETFATAVSLGEMAEVVIEGLEPITKISYQIYDREGNTVKEGGYGFSDEGVSRFALKDVLPMEELKVYETENAIYIETDLLGPESTEEIVETETYPYVVVKVEDNEKYVVFD